MTDRPVGLTSAEAERRRQSGLGNQTAPPTSRSYWEILRHNVFTFVNIVIFALGAALVALGRRGDALTSVVVVLSNVVVSVVQEVRAKRKLDRIALLTRPTVTVIRDGREVTLDPGQVVQGDLVVARAGDQIVADGVLTAGGQIEVDESLLTGEANMVSKRPGEAVLSGSFCASGQGYYEAQKVGAQSMAYQLTTGARAFRRVATPLQRHITRIVEILLPMAIVMEAVLIVAAVIGNMPLVEVVRVSTVLFGLVPQGLFLASAVAYALGAVRMAERGLLVNQANAVESLSHVNVLCLDKTGTLTANHIQFNEVYPLGAPEAELRAALGDFAASLSAANRTSQALAAALPGAVHAVAEEVSFSSARKWSGLTFGPDAPGGPLILGAPEILQPHLADAPAGEAQAQAWAAEGLRVVLFAQAPPGAQLHDALGQPRLPDGLRPLGLVSLSDELRPEARETLSRFAQAGIQVKLISGDNPETVAALARRAGLSAEAQLITGPQLAALGPAEFAEAARTATIFGRILPQQKADLVQALKQQGGYVAMIGDGVNDVLSLKRAHVGISMESGSAATRAVADLVLLGDRFGALPYAFTEGQRIRSGLQDNLKLFLTRALAVAALVILTAVAGFGFPFGPKQSSLVALFTVGLPSLALAAWARPSPRSWQAMLRSVIRFVAPAVVTLTVAADAVYLGFGYAAQAGHWAVAPGSSHLGPRAAMLSAAQGAVTVFMILAGLLLLTFIEPPTTGWTAGERERGDRRLTWLGLGLAAVFGVILAWPPLRDFFELYPFSLESYLVLLAALLAWALVLRWVWSSGVLRRFRFLSEAGLQVFAVAETDSSA